MTYCGSTLIQWPYVKTNYIFVSFKLIFKKWNHRLYVESLINIYLKLLKTYLIKYFLYSDINECSGSNDCHPTLATCSNSPGGYSCACKAGYSGDGRTCTGLYCSFVFKTREKFCKKKKKKTSEFRMGLSLLQNWIINPWKVTNIQTLTMFFFH